MPSSEFINSGFLKGLSTPWSNDSTGSCHSNPPAFRNETEGCLKLEGAKAHDEVKADAAAAKIRMALIMILISAEYFVDASNIPA